MTEQVSGVPVSEYSYYDVVLAAIPLILTVTGVTGVILSPPLELLLGAGGCIAVMLIGYVLFINPPETTLAA